MKVFITGGGGFLGKHIILQLLQKGHEVTSYSRGEYPELEEQGVKTIQGSLEDKQKLAEASIGHDVIFHTASKVAMWGRKEDFYQTNVLGTANVLSACRNNNIPHLIYTSTPSVVFQYDSLRGEDESLPYAKNSYSRYAESKAIAEKMVLEANGENLKTLSLRPHLVFGPGDQNLIPRLVEGQKKGKLKIVGNGENQVDVLYVENAAEAHLMAWKALRDSPEKVEGRPYFLGQGPVKLWDFINEVLELHNLPPVKKKIPFNTAFQIGKFIEMGSSLFGKYNYHPPMTRFVALQLSKDHFFTHENAKNDFGWTPTVTLKEGLGRLVSSSVK
ncbi:MAG: NAD-dependent epimerase/dehydratase family protein [Halobacteriovoraceae bacterium]|nr:NAD-dependent epimerase/dehydratase family protein [Halobacteriovoraceae bacterium]